MSNSIVFLNIVLFILYPIPQDETYFQSKFYLNAQIKIEDLILFPWEQWEAGSFTSIKGL